MHKSHYDKCLETMYGMRRFGIKLGLETITSILAHIGDPHKNYPIIHIAGTNGKGSVAAMLSTILHTAGYKVGRYTSPHLERFNERICVNNKPINDEAVISSYEMVASAPELERELTFFEFTTAMALYEFGRQKVDWAVIETGMGGRLDATNAVQPDLTIITNISLEHRSYLGDTLAAIAGEKAGIIKPKVPLITGVAQRNARDVIFQKASQQNVPVFLKGRDFRCRRVGDGIRFSYYGMTQTRRNLTLSLQGDHQIDNAALVLAACETLIDSGKVELPQEAISQGLLNTSWPGRLEVVSTNPHLILDGAHNLMAARKLANYLKTQFQGRHITLVIGVLDDKPSESILRDIMAPCQRVVITQPTIDRAIPAEKLADTAKKYASQIDIIPDVARALDHALKESGPDDVICVAGSLYVVGEAKSHIQTLR